MVVLPLSWHCDLCCSDGKGSFLRLDNKKDKNKDKKRNQRCEKRRKESGDVQGALFVGSALYPQDAMVRRLRRGENASLPVSSPRKH